VRQSGAGGRPSVLAATGPPSARPINAPRYAADDGRRHRPHVPVGDRGGLRHPGHRNRTRVRSLVLHNARPSLRSGRSGNVMSEPSRGGALLAHNGDAMLGLRRAYAVGAAGGRPRSSPTRRVPPQSRRERGRGVAHARERRRRRPSPTTYNGRRYDAGGGPGRRQWAVNVATPSATQLGNTRRTGRTQRIYSPPVTCTDVRGGSW
jgi:hypothetical protein